VLVTVPRNQLDRYRAAVQRFAAHEHKWRNLQLEYISVIHEKARLGPNVRVLIDVITDSGESEEAGDAANEAAVQGLGHLKLSDLSSTVTTEIVEASRLGVDSIDEK
jgi:hypothetical protein